MPEFAGSDYDPKRDKRRLTGQWLRVHRFMWSRGWFTLMQIAEGADVPATTVATRVRDLRKKDFGGNGLEGDDSNVLKKRIGNLFYYKLIPTEPNGQGVLFK